jgi:hypothetical protein
MTNRVGHHFPAIRSLFAYHIIVNIYSHLIGSMLFVVLPIYIFRTEIPYDPESQFENRQAGNAT